MTTTQHAEQPAAPETIAVRSIEPRGLVSRDAARYCGISWATWRRMRAKGLLPAPWFQLEAKDRGASLLIYDRRVLDRWIETRQELADAPRNPLMVAVPTPRIDVRRGRLVRRRSGSRA